MPQFRFSMVIDGVERTKKVEIPESELHTTFAKYLGEDYKQMYRRNVIERYMNKWALSKLNLSWEEVQEHEGHADHAHSTTPKSKAEKADERGLQTHGKREAK